jgi:hypothetical protein
LTISKLYSFNSVLFDALDGAIREDALLLSVCENALNGPVREAKGDYLNSNITLFLLCHLGSASQSDCLQI